MTHVTCRFPPLVLQHFATIVFQYDACVPFVFSRVTLGTQAGWPNETWQGANGWGVLSCVMGLSIHTAVVWKNPANQLRSLDGYAWWHYDLFRKDSNIPGHLWFITQDCRRIWPRSCNDEIDTIFHTYHILKEQFLDCFQDRSTIVPEFQFERVFIYIARFRPKTIFPTTSLTKMCWESYRYAATPVGRENQEIGIETWDQERPQHALYPHT